MGKIIIISAPSGSGKSTLINKLMQNERLKLEFSISATTRQPRGQEKDGQDYHFMTVENFQKEIENDGFIEWQEVYQGRYYGTLKSEIERIFSKGNNIIFDVDVEGGINLKNIFRDQSLSIFIKPPSIEELKRRLENRATDSAAEIEKRIDKASQELERAPLFDQIIINDNLQLATQELLIKAEQFLEEKQ